MTPHSATAADCSSASQNCNPPPLQRTPSDSRDREGSGSHRALVVDDNLELLEVAATLFEECGYEVLTASDGAQAMDILRRTPDIEVLFSDVVMPGMSGIQLGHQAKKMIGDIKVILASGYTAITANTGQGTIRDFDFVKKPYRFSDILRMLAKPD
jgi:CheY-like chemotaxis protein